MPPQTLAVQSDRQWPPNQSLSGSGISVVSATPPSADTDSNGTADVTYAYDALRRRVKKTTTGEAAQSLVFASLGHDLLSDYLAGSVAATPQRNYAYSGRIDEPVALIDYTASGTLGA